MIRQAREEDLPALRDLERAADQLFRDLGMDAVAEGEPTPLAALSAYRRDGRAWVFADDRDRPLAFLLLDVIDGAAHIEQVSVMPTAARRGVGAALIRAAADWARQHGCDALTLMTFRDVPWNAPTTNGWASRSSKTSS